MKSFNRILFNVGLVVLAPGLACAAGTYYNGNLYQNPQRQYQMNGNGGYNGYNNNSYNYGMGRGYNQNMQVANMRQNTVQAQMSGQNSVQNQPMPEQEVSKNSNQKQGLVLGVGVAHESANWNISMNEAGSNLRYDGLSWNVVDGRATYYFGNDIPMQIKIGAKYGKQYDEILMIDDDITAEKMWEVREDIEGNEYVEGIPALSVGTGKDGSQMGFNAALGLTDLFRIGHLKITPSIGYRYFKYNLETKNNYGLAVNVVHSGSVVNCIEMESGEVQCNPFVGFMDATGNIVSVAGFYINTDGEFVQNSDGSYQILNNQTAPQISVGNTYYYEQDGISHKYETEWSGPYLALDMEYKINDDNFINIGLEYGMPIYNSKGDQPYRFDWAHPTSVEDSGELGDAVHFALNSDWSTQVTDSVWLSLGFTYDYYKVGDATAKTYLSSSYYLPILESYQAASGEPEFTESDEQTLAELLALQANGWTIESPNEIESIYKSMGIRAGLNIKF